MLHSIKQIDSGHWEIDGYTIRYESVEHTREYLKYDKVNWYRDYYIGRNSAGEQVTDAHTKFEDCLGELIFIIEDSATVEEE